MINTPGHNPDEHESTGLLQKIASLRPAIAAAALALITACAPERAGSHIEISDPQANAELEKLRKKFEYDTQRVKYDSNEEEDIALAGILGRRDMLLESNGIPARTERWYASGGNGEGPYMRTEVDERSCEEAPVCSVALPSSKYPEIEEE